eukprot:gene11664-biopygen15433
MQRPNVRRSTVNGALSRQAGAALGQKIGPRSLPKDALTRAAAGHRRPRPRRQPAAPREKRLRTR